jgi:hypothetical protein
MKKIIKEWRTFQKLNEANYGKLGELGINIFLKNFADSNNADKQKAMYDWSIDNMPSNIAKDSDEFLKLKNGYAFNWADMTTKELAEENIQKQVDLWKEELWSEILSGNNDAKREMMFFNSYLDKFLDDEVAQTGSRTDMDYKAQKAGLDGQMDDWFLGRGGYPYFKRAMRRAMAELMERRKALKAKK